MNINEYPTPLTYAEIEACPDLPIHLVRTEFAKTLERKNAALRDAFQGLRDCDYMTVDAVKRLARDILEATK